MGYKVLYNNQILFDPYTDDCITDTKLSSKANAASYFDFTISPAHSLYSKIAERAGEVRVYFDKIILFKGEITEIEEDFNGNRSISCTGVLENLDATRVRPYSTVKGEQPLTAPSSIDGYFQWLIDQHNSNCLDSRKQFSVGVNQGSMLDKNNYIYRSSEQRPTTASEIEEKILDSVGGYLFVRYKDDLNILDLYADAHEANTQIIDFGVNITDFTKTTTTSDQYTAVVATGYTPDPPKDQTNVKMKPITLKGCPDGGTPYSSTIVKMGDRVYDINAVTRYGYREYYVSNTDIKTYDGLLAYACKILNTLLSPSLSISVNAVDLALYMNNGYDHLQLGQAVRVRAKPHNIDEYLMVNSIELDLNDPGRTNYELGATYDTLTGQQSSYLKSLNSSINSSLDTVAALGDDVKKSAKLAKDANETATNANTKAENASKTANDAQLKAEEAAKKSNDAISASKDASDKAYEASKKADDATAKTEVIQNTLTQISGDTAQAVANAKKAQEAAEAAKAAADDAQASASTNATEVGKVKSQIGIINGEISNVKQESANIRDDLSGQITTVKNTMEADYSRKTDLTSTTETLRNEISESAAGVLRTVSSDYASKEELKTTTDATNKNTKDLATLSNHVETTYSTKSEVKQLSDTVSSTVSSVETIRINAEAAKTSADNANAAADEAQKAADTAKANASTAQSIADAAKKNLEAAQKNLEALQGQADATDEQLTAAKANVEKAKQAANDAQAAANTAKDNAATAQATANAAKGAADAAQKDVNALKNRVTNAETSIKQNSDAIALRATKTEVTSAIDDIKMGGRNLYTGTADFSNVSGGHVWKNLEKWNIVSSVIGYQGILKDAYCSDLWYGVYQEIYLPVGTYTFSGYLSKSGNAADFKVDAFFTPPKDSSITNPATIILADYVVAQKVTKEYVRYSVTFSVSNPGIVCARFEKANGTTTSNDKFWVTALKLESGNKATDWSPAPEDLRADATDKSNTALSESKKYTDAQLKITSESITSSISSTYTPKHYPDTRDDNNTPDWYIKNYPRQSITEFKRCSTIGLSGDTYCSLLTEVPWDNATGGYPKQTASVLNKRYWRVGTNGSTWGAWNDVTGLATTASSNASTALSTANAAKSTADTVKTDLANLKIGGRNLLLGTGTKLTITGNNAENQGGAIYYLFNKAMKNLPKGTYVFHCDIVGTVAGGTVRPQWNATPWTNWGTYNVSTKTKHVENTFTLTPDSSYKATGVMLRLDNVAGTVTVSHMMLEMGNKASDWTPALEDYSTTTIMQSEIDQTAESIKSTVAATYVNNETLSSYATQSQLEQTSTSLTSRIQTAETTVEGMSTTVKNVNDYMTFARENNQPTLTIGSSSSSFRTKLTNTGEKFMQGDQKVMELDGVSSTVKASRVQMGNYQWRDTGNSMQLVYIP